MESSINHSSWKHSNTIDETKFPYFGNQLKQGISIPKRRHHIMTRQIRTRINVVYNAIATPATIAAIAPLMYTPMPVDLVASPVAFSTTLFKNSSWSFRFFSM